MKDFFPNFKIKIIQIAIAMLLFLKITSYDISSCSNGQSLTDDSCFNNLIQFENYRAGQFGEDKNGNLFLLYSGTQDPKKRLFYGIKDNGRSYFAQNEKKEIDITPVGSTVQREESRIIFVTPSDGKQYLFSTSAGYPHSTLAEMYSIGENKISSYSKLTKNVLQGVENSFITSTQYSLIKSSEENKYLLAYAQSTSIIIKKFRFTRPNLGEKNELK